MKKTTNKLNKEQNALKVLLTNEVENLKEEVRMLAYAKEKIETLEKRIITIEQILKSFA